MEDLVTTFTSVSEPSKAMEALALVQKYVLEPSRAVDVLVNISKSSDLVVALVRVILCRLLFNKETV